MKKRIYDGTIATAINDWRAHIQNVYKSKPQQLLELNAQADEAEAAYVRFEARLNKILSAARSESVSYDALKKVRTAESCLNELIVDGKNVLEEFTNKHLNIGAQCVVYRQMAYVAWTAMIYDVAARATKELEARMPQLIEEEGESMKVMATLGSLDLAMNFLGDWDAMSKQ